MLQSLCLPTPSTNYCSILTVAPRSCSQNVQRKNIHQQQNSTRIWLNKSSSSPELSAEYLDAHLPCLSHGKLLSDLCTWGVGGPAKLYCEVRSELHLASIIRYCCSKGIRFLILGNGSNCLFDDRGFDGCIIHNKISFLQRLHPGVYSAGSGYPFNVLGIQCSRDGFTGLEFASGIPGTVGGAVFMNAGANGQETASVLKSVEIITTSGAKEVIDRNELVYSYRCSPFQDAWRDFGAISGATFELIPSPTSKETQKAYLERRKKTQPLTDRTAGCVFRNPASLDQSAGYLIEKAGLKGTTIGGAKVSETHANFFVNADGSQSKDILNLISFVKEQVRNKFDVDLHEEIMYIPYT